MLLLVFYVNLARVNTPVVGSHSRQPAAASLKFELSNDHAHRASSTYERDNRARSIDDPGFKKNGNTYHCVMGDTRPTQRCEQLLQWTSSPTISCDFDSDTQQ